jgi:hypothetical protein
VVAVSLKKPVTLVSDIKKFPVRDAETGRRVILQIYDPKRVSQTRGITRFAPIRNVTGMFDDLFFAKLVQAQVVSSFGFIRQRSDPFTGGSPAQHGAQTTETQDDGTTRTVEGISPGMELTAPPGETINPFSPNVPNPEFFEHALMILTFIAVNLDIPVQVLLLDPRQTNFSGWRGAMDQAKRGFRRIQGRLARQWVRPVYQWKVLQWLAEDGELRALADQPDVEPLRLRCNLPGFPYIEPHKDAQGDSLRIQKVLTSPRRVARERGADYEELAAESVADRGLLIRLAIELAAQINKDNPEASVNWREIANFDLKAMPQGKSAGRGKAMEDIARGVRAGVPIATSEARLALALPAEAPADQTLLRFNDQDVLAYHIEGGVLTINETRKRLGLPEVPWGDVPVRREGIKIASTKGPQEGAEDEEEEDEESEDGR